MLIVYRPTSGSGELSTKIYIEVVLGSRDAAFYICQQKQKKQLKISDACQKFKNAICRGEKNSADNVLTVGGTTGIGDGGLV